MQQKYRGLRNSEAKADGDAYEEKRLSKIADAYVGMETGEGADWDIGSDDNSEEKNPMMHSARKGSFILSAQRAWNNWNNPLLIPEVRFAVFCVVLTFSCW